MIHAQRVGVCGVRVTRGYIEGANEITRSSAKRHPKFMSRVISVILLNVIISVTFIGLNNIIIVINLRKRHSFEE